MPGPLSLAAAFSGIIRFINTPICHPEPQRRISHSKVLRDPSLRLRMTDRNCHWKYIYRGAPMADTTIYRLALIGFGSAGQGLAQILRDHGDALARRYGVDLRIVAVCTQRRGSLFDPDGLDPAALLEAIQQAGHLRNVAGQRDWSPLDIIEQADADVLVELSPTDLTTGEPATSHMRAALSHRMHAIT